jgi:hypothetical protein
MLQKEDTGDDFTRNLVETTNKSIGEIKKQFEQHKNTAVDLLLHFVCSVKLVISDASRQAFVDDQ